MRVAVLNPHMRRHYSGPTVYMNRLFGKIASNRSLEVTAIGPQLPKAQSDVITYTVLKTPDLNKAGGQIVWTFKALFWLYRNRASYDLVHFHGLYLFNLLCALVPLVLLKPYVVLPLGAGGDLRVDSRSNKIPLVSHLKRFILRRSKKAFALSAENASELRAFGVPLENITRIENPASEVFFRAPNAHTKDTHSMVLIGKLGPGKRPELAIKALNNLRSNGWHSASLTLVGPFESEHYEDTLRKLVDDLNLNEAVHITGYVDDMVELLTDLSNAIFVLPSSQEGLPGALTEAMAMGMPAVVTDVGSMGEVVRASGGGYIIEPEAPAVAAAVDGLWKNRELWFKTAMAAHSYAKIHFSEEAVAEKYVSSLEGL